MRWLLIVALTLCAAAHAKAQQDPFDTTADRPLERSAIQPVRQLDTLDPEATSIPPRPDLPGSDSSVTAETRTTGGAPMQRAAPAHQLVSGTAPLDSAAPPRLEPPRKTLPLAPAKGRASDSDRGRRGLPSAANLIGSLALVVGLFLLVAWFLRRAMPRSAGVLPREVVGVLGRYPLARGNDAQLLRCGSKLLLVSVTSGGAETLTEITDPDEVVRIAALCHEGLKPAADFRQVLDQTGRERSASRKRREPDIERLDLSAFAALGSGESDRHA